MTRLSFVEILRLGFAKREPGLILLGLADFLKRDIGLLLTRWSTALLYVFDRRVSWCLESRKPGRIVIQSMKSKRDTTKPSTGYFVTFFNLANYRVFNKKDRVKCGVRKMALAALVIISGTLHII